MSHYNLQKLFNYFKIEPQSINVLAPVHCNNLRLDSRLVKSNDIFIALKGQFFDGKDFIPQAIESGAIAVLIETDDISENKHIEYYTIGSKEIPLVYLYQLNEQLSAFANEFYDHISEKMKIIGVTGTNGKTTITQLIAQWVTLLGGKSAVLGTLGNGIYNHLIPSANTTSSSVEIQAHLAEFYQKNVNLVAMEISSHGLAIGRVKDVSFSASLFTNLSRDHLDFHKTMDAYKQAKWSLFSSNAQECAVKNAGKKIINFDDHVGQEWIAQLDNIIVVSSIPDNLSIIRNLGKTYIGVSELIYNEKGVLITIESSFGKGQLTSHLIGAFNVSNLLLAFAALMALDYPFNALISTSSNLQPVCGRMEIFSAHNKPTVIVDYAHTPDALDKVLNATKEHCMGALWVVFGCGGDRDKGKRPLMAQIAETYADNIVVTNDNPRTENQEEIIQDIIKGFNNLDQVHIVPDRIKAIESAICHAHEKDIIVVAGKGHEDYQIIGKTKHHYSDRETVSHLLGITL